MQMQEYPWLRLEGIKKSGEMEAGIAKEKTEWYMSKKPVTTWQ